MESKKEPVRPTRPAAPWMGGKRALSKIICPLIDNTPHTAYVEPFVGMGGVFFRRRARPNCEVINDYSGDVSNFFRILQRHYVQFMEVMKFSLTTRREFERLKATDPRTLTDLERAARFIYLQRTAFGGKVTGQNFGVQMDKGSRFNITELGPLLEDIHDRLSGVIIENLDFGDLIPRYDKKEVLFYLDPPYWGCEGDYGKELFTPQDFARLADILRALKGRFILSLNDTDGVRATFDGFHFQEETLTYTVGGGDKAMTAKEVLISNFKLDEAQPQGALGFDE